MLREITLRPNQSPYLRRLRIEREIFRHDANNFARLVVDRKHVSNKFLSSQPPAPESIRKLRSAWIIRIACSERPPLGCPCAKRGEKIRAHRNSVYSLHFPVQPNRRRHARPRNRRKCFEALAVLCPFLKFAIRVEPRPASPMRRVALPDHREAFWILLGQRLEQHCVQNTEQCRVRADSQHQRERGHRSESRRLAQHPHAITHVLLQRIDERNPTPRAITFLSLLHSSQLNQRLPPRFAGQHSVPQVIFDVHSQMRIQLRGQLAVALLTPKHSGQANEYCANHLHSVLIRTAAQPSGPHASLSAQERTPRVVPQRGPARPPTQKSQDR